jgi:hypothetical protein
MCVLIRMLCMDAAVDHPAHVVFHKLMGQFAIISHQ